MNRFTKTKAKAEESFVLFYKQRGIEPPEGLIKAMLIQAENIAYVLIKMVIQDIAKKTDEAKIKKNVKMIVDTSNSNN
jgi:hypothetical protein